MRFAVGPLSLSEPIGDDTTELGDLVEDHSVQSPYEAAVLAMLPLEVAALLGVLDERSNSSSRCASVSTAEPRTLAEVGDEFNLTARAHPPDRSQGDVETASPVVRQPTSTP